MLCYPIQNSDQIIIFSTRLRWRKYKYEYYLVFIYFSLSIIINSTTIHLRIYHGNRAAALWASRSEKLS
ncbi:hypothetical protein DERP_007146 [Dermatophagoides pteronyssinus]|uniref:Uncharacterized protein n=1 Tax=Dermatophagoides pteronyssinus TaxID=6956 RepID=A0ABQ8JV72_DERPT|nr:hypothetical protein DERP_007146 [Dermatophagoides pteronyssinus]